MDRDNVKIENIFKTEDNEARKEAVLASLILLVEKLEFMESKER